MRQTFRNSLAVATITGLSMALSGCANFHRVSAAANKDARQAKAYVAQMSHPLPQAGTGRFVRTDAVWTSGRAIVYSHGQPLPAAVEADGVTLWSGAPATLPQLANLVSAKTGIPVALSTDLRRGTRHGVPEGLPPATPTGMINSTLATANGRGAPVPPLPTAAEIQASSLDTPARTMPVDFTGPLSQFLDMVADQFDVSWRYDGAQIKIFRNITRTWTIAALPSTENMSVSMSSTNSLSGAASTGTGAAGVGQSLKGSYATESSMKMSVNVWKGILAGLKNVVAGQGEINATRATGTLTVTAPPAVMRRVELFINSQNRRLSKMVAVSIRVLTVTATRDDNNNFSLNQVFSNLGHLGGYSLNLGNSSAVASAAATALSSTAPGLAVGVLSPTSAISGSNAIVSALSSLGKVGTLYDTAVTTMNGIPAPIQVSHTQAYLASVATTDLGGTIGGSQQMLTPGVVTTGVSFSVIPRVDPGQDGVLLSYTMTVSALVGPHNGFNIVTSGGQQLELPDVDSQEFSQQADLKSGATVVLAGYNQISDTINHTGTMDPYNFLLGGAAQADHTHQIVILLLTPVVVQTPEMIREDKR